MRQIKRSKKVIESAIKALSEPKKKQYLIHFKSYSYDNFYMLTSNMKLFNMKTGKLKISAKKFCETYIPYEYEGWKNNKFKYELFEASSVNSNGIAMFLNKINCGPFSSVEVEKIDTNEMPEDVAIFSDGITYVD
jgi:hypothetical protein